MKTFYIIFAPSNKTNKIIKIIMKTKVTYRINSIQESATYIHEYWDDILIYKWRVAAIYHGGDVQEFLEKNDALRMPNFDGLNEFHRRVSILDFY